ncbi:MAG: tRNA (adenosine(37)-N6)-dimethylallyltransferase MiaA [Deltaproteobacteria bacterium]|nr:tRNA (adenosine(37)-N6)-dimethylallyltransferase MiaA [Deltaproteobacteria bacterium]
MTSTKPKLIIISGPTAAGKTDVALELAEPLGGEIISADAMQVYKHMDIGTAKPAPEQLARVPHHLIDVVAPDEPFSAAIFRTMADAVIQGLHEKGRLSFVVGGTGLYIKALIRGLFPAPEQDETIRKRLRDEAKTSGSDVLYARLQQVDPAAAGKLHPNDTYRIIRALEVHELTAQPISQLQASHGFQDRRYRILWIGLTLDRDILYDRIDQRVDLMLASGLLEEVKQLLDQGYSSNLKSMRSIGYRHMADHLEQGVAWDETVRLLKRDTRRFAKRQLTWLRAYPEIQWMEPGDREGMAKQIDLFLTQGAAQPTNVKRGF